MWHWLVVILDLVLINIVLFGWNEMRASVRRLMIALTMATALFYFVPVSYASFDDMKQVQFCLRCHEMKPFGDGLEIDDDEVLSAVHYQNNYVPQKTACYACHTDYRMFGGVKAKMAGMKHLWVHMTQNKSRDEIKLYHPYDTANCLQCHGPSKRFQNVKNHKSEGRLPKIMDGSMSCLESGCHDTAHYFEEGEGEGNEEASDTATKANGDKDDE